MSGPSTTFEKLYEVDNTIHGYSQKCTRLPFRVVLCLCLKIAAIMVSETPYHGIIDFAQLSSVLFEPNKEVSRNTQIGADCLIRQLSVSKMVVELGQEVRMLASDCL